MINRRLFVAGTMAFGATGRWALRAAVTELIEPQPYFASVMRAIDALSATGQPMDASDASKIAQLSVKSDAEAVASAEAILARYTFAAITLDARGEGAAVLGGGERVLIEQGWKSLLVRISNSARLTEKFDVAVAGRLWMGDGPGKMSAPNFEQEAGVRDTLFLEPWIEKSWLVAGVPNNERLTGALVEYGTIDLFSRDRGKKSGKLGFGVGDERAMSAAYASPLLFDSHALPTDDIALSILDSDGVGCMASLIVEDHRGHIYPPQTMRLAPDMFYQPFIYRANDETVRLPDGDYTVTSWRGPEYVRQVQSVRISENSRRIAIKLERWINPAKWGWYSGDTHLHAAGCAHYMHPTEGVNPETMIRHVRGEALSVGDVLTWGPGYYHQKQFFTAHAISPEAALEYPELQSANNATLKPKPTPNDNESIIRYDVEVSGFPSSHSGHLVLLRLKSQDYPNTKTIEDWPSWNLPILKWVKDQGGVAGFAHCSHGMAVSSKELPNYEIPAFDGVGTQEAIVDITHDACDFLEGAYGAPVTELNVWYHMLNCGYTPAMVGGTDYPCVTPTNDARPGIRRTYIKLNTPPVDDGGFNDWVQGICEGHLYCGDGRTHFLSFTANGHASGKTPIPLPSARSIEVKVLVAAMLEAEPSPNTLANAAEEAWHIEHARIGKTRNVAVELIINGQPVEKQEILADGKPRAIKFRARIERSSWVALRVLGSGHTYPVFLNLRDMPIRASRRSAEWLRKCVDALWQEKHGMIRDSERPAAAEAYDHARLTYDRIIAESDLA